MPSMPMTYNDLLVVGMRHRRSIGLWISSIALLSLSGVLVYSHGSALRRLQDHTIPAAMELPALERRLSSLRAQIELAELHAALQTGSIDEVIRTRVIPNGTDLASLLAAIDMASAVGIADGSVRSVGAIGVDGPIPVIIPGVVLAPQEQLVGFDLTLPIVATREGVERFLLLTDVAGLLTVGDALGKEQQEMLLQVTEEENPASVTALEQFFSEDLLRYALDPSFAERQLLKSFSGPLMERALEHVTQESRLRDVQKVLGGALGERLHRNGLWPLRLLEPTSIQMEQLPGNMVRLTLVVRAYARQVQKED